MPSVSCTTVLKAISDDPQRRKALAEWTRELTPMDVRDFEFPVDPTTGRVKLVFREASNRRVSAYAASDGNRRFIAMLAGLLGTDSERLYVFEEIDNGIHPSPNAAAAQPDRRTDGEGTNPGSDYHAVDGPVHAGALEARPDGMFAASLDDAGGDAQAPGPERGIAHALTVADEIGDAFAGLVAGWGGGRGRRRWR